MEDAKVIGQIDKLAREEHELFERESRGHATKVDQERLRQLETMLDQCWDLLRQRRAKREFGEDPNDAQLRDPKTVKNYIG
jgi:hypothetical protein